MKIGCAEVPQKGAIMFRAGVRYRSCRRGKTSRRGNAAQEAPDGQHLAERNTREHPTPVLPRGSMPSGKGCPSGAEATDKRASEIGVARSSRTAPGACRFAPRHTVTRASGISYRQSKENAVGRPSGERHGIRVIPVAEAQGGAVKRGNCLTEIGRVLRPCRLAGGMHCELRHADIHGV